MTEKIVIHLAGKPDGLVQKCVRCGHVLQDYTNAQSVGDWKPVWWSGNVVVNERFSGTTDEAPNCHGGSDANAYSLNLPFWIDDGELDGLTPQEIFVLGFEFCSIYGSILEGGAWDQYSRPFHSENEPRVRKMCEHLGVDYSIQAHDDWPVLIIRRKE